MRVATGGVVWLCVSERGEGGESENETERRIHAHACACARERDAHWHTRDHQELSQTLQNQLDQDYRLDAKWVYTNV